VFLPGGPYCRIGCEQPGNDLCYVPFHRLSLPPTRRML
jgi:hypothetical protein